MLVFTCPSAAFGITAILPRPQGLLPPTLPATAATASPQTTSSFACSVSPACAHRSWFMLCFLGKKTCLQPMQHACPIDQCCASILDQGASLLPLQQIKLNFLHRAVYQMVA